MTRRIVWISLAVAAFLVLVGSWLVTKFEQVPVETWTPPGKEAQRNPNLALERFMAAMGRSLARADNAAFLDQLAPGGTLILDNHRRAHMFPARVKRLMAWVEGGGHLIVAPEQPGVEDPVLAFFRVDCSCKADPPKGKRPPAPQTIAVDIPNAPRPLKIDFPGSSMTPSDLPTDWRAGAPGYPDQILHFRHGVGHVTMVPSFSRLFNNHNIGRHDHAEFLWTLVETYQPDRARPVTLVSRLSIPSLWEWLADSAWTALISAAALIVLWLWRVVPRFGPVRPEPEPARREIGEHLRAVGRYVWRQGGLEHWLEAARESFRKRLALRHPALLALPPAEQAAALAEMTRRPVTHIAAALHGPAASPHAFTQALRTLYKLERTL